MPRRYRYLNCMGELIRMSESAYRRMLTDYAIGKPQDMDHYGVSIGDVENVTDLSADAAQMALEYLDRKKA